MKRLIVCLLFVCCLFALPAAGLAANTITLGANTVVIEDIDSDWTWSDSINNALSGIRVLSIQFNGGAADDQCVIMTDGAATGAVIFDVTVEDTYDQRLKWFNGVRHKPFLDYSAGTFTAGSKVIIEFER